jgi:hypothetical protein
VLTKSDLASFRQCRRKLWLEHHSPELATTGDAVTWRRARDGTIVGEKARELLGTGTIWPSSAADRESAATQAMAQLSASPDHAAVEVPLCRTGLYARADALIPIPSHGYVLQETKASTFPLKKDKATPGKVDDHLLDDLAIQVWVYEATGWPLARAELNLIHNQWRYPGNSDYSGLFRQLVVTEELKARVAEVPKWLEAAQSVLAGELPALQTGRHCEKPYACAFNEHCVTLDVSGPEHSIELLPGIAGKNLAKKLKAERGYTSLLEPSAAELTGNDAALYLRMQAAHRTGEAILEWDSGGTLEGLPYPRYYFDFEGIDLPVPYWFGVRPYEQIPFQWSCHVESAPGVFEHAEFLDLSGEDPSVPCIERMLDAIPPDGLGPIFVYFQTYEEGRLRELAERHPTYAADLSLYIGRLVDLHPLVRAHYYHPAMRGSFSIKPVLPTIAPDLDYAALGEVSDGIAAQVAYLYAAFDAETTPQRKESLRESLLRYCKQDTWAMVEVAYHLQRRGRPPRLEYL